MKNEPTKETGITIQRYQCDAPVTQEQEDDDNYQNESLVHRLFHFVDGGADEFGIVESVAVMYIVRQVLFHLLHAFIYGIGDIDMIGTG